VLGTIDTMLRGRATVLVTLLCLAACSPAPSGGSATPAAHPTGTAAIETAAVTPGPSLPGQSDTEWGRIWDALPPWFPIPDGASPTETGEGSYTAELALPAGSTAQLAADFYRTAFQAAGFTAIDVDGPLEDGSFVVAVPGSCHIEVRIAPLGSEVVAFVLYGAGCPFE
jgi:hypothetical protein